MLEKLCNLAGASGDETEVRTLIREQIEPLADEIIEDTMGNLIALKKGRKGEKRIMAAAHMDEVGFIIKEITDKGYLKFDMVGGIDSKILVSKRVCIGKDAVPGVIGIKAIHCQSKEEREGKIDYKRLYIDIGASSKEAAEKKVSLGDYAVFAPKYLDLGDNIVSKALDDRLGCMILIRLMQEEYDDDVYFCFTVQEEVGIRGARTAAYRIRPDYTVVVETTTCNDVYGSKEREYNTRFGGGAVLTLMDGTSISDKELITNLYRRATEAAIPVQYKTLARGGNDTGSMQTAVGGARSISLSLACKYLHSPVCMANKKDIEALYDTTKLFLQEGCLR